MKGYNHQISLGNAGLIRLSISFLHGSQSLIFFLTNAYEQEVGCWLSPNTLTLDSSFIVEFGVS